MIHNCGIYWSNVVSVPGLFKALYYYVNWQELNSVRTLFFIQKFNSLMNLLWSNEKPQIWTDRKVWWETTDEQIWIENLTGYCFMSKYGQFKLPYLEIFELIVFSKKSKNWLQWDLTHQSGSLFRHILYCTTEPADIPCKWFLYNTKQQEVTGVIICKSNFSLEICSSEFFHRTFPSDSYGRFFIELLALWIKLKVYLHNLVLAHTLSLLISWEHSSVRPRIRTHATQVDLLLYY